MRYESCFLSLLFCHNIIIVIKRVRIQIQLTEEQAQALNEIAHAQHISMAELVRRQMDTLIRGRKMHQAGISSLLAALIVLKKGR
ncbi:MAG: ribbon-helix-helix protein, CopG family [Spirochaetia bacterium]